MLDDPQEQKNLADGDHSDRNNFAGAVHADANRSDENRDDVFAPV